MEADGVGQGQGLAGADACVFGISAGHLRRRPWQYLRTTIGAAGEAGGAAAAADEGLRADPRPGLPLASQVATDGDDFAGEFVPHNVAGLQLAPADIGVRAFRPMQVRAADAAALDLENQFLGPGFRVGHVLDDERLARRLEHRCLHLGRLTLLQWFIVQK